MQSDLFAGKGEPTLGKIFGLSVSCCTRCSQDNVCLPAIVSLIYWPTCCGRDGKELFFISVDRKMMAVDVNLGATVTAGVPHELFPVSDFLLLAQRYDVSADGQRFLMFSPGSAVGNAPITVVMNWWAGLKK